MKKVDYDFVPSDKTLTPIKSCVNISEERISSDAIVRVVVSDLNKQLTNCRVVNTGLAGSTNRPAPGKRTEHYWANLSDRSKGYIHITEE